MADKELFGNSEQLDCSDCVNHGGDWDCDHVQCRKGADTISRRQAIYVCLELVHERRKWLSDAGQKEIIGIDAAMCAIQDLPSAQPTLYGYDIKHLAFVASIMAKKGVSPEEAVAIFRDVNRVIEMMLEDMKEMQENAVKQALKKPWEGDHHED